MTTSLDKAKQEMAPQWVELTKSVRDHASACLDGSESNDATTALAEEALRLCDHVDRLHADLGELLTALDATGDSGPGRDPDAREIDMAAIETQRETHETSDSPRDILKALLMWRDDPAERVRHDPG